MLKRELEVLQRSDLTLLVLRMQSMHQNQSQKDLVLPTRDITELLQDPLREVLLLMNKIILLLIKNLLMKLQVVMKNKLKVVMNNKVRNNNMNIKKENTKRKN